METVRNPNLPVGSSDSQNVEIINSVRIARSKGHRFIRLIHRTDGLVPERVFPVEGIRVRHTINMKTKAPENACTIIDGAACVFVPDALTGVREAFLLDTPHNRDFLASHVLEDRWEIEDDRVRDEIEAMAKKKPVVVDTTRMSVMSSQQHVSQEPGSDVTMLSKQQKEDLIAKRKKEIELLEKGLELDEVIEEGNEDAAPKTPTAASGSAAFNEQIRKSIPGHIKARATRTVYAKHSTRVAELKAKYGIEGMKESEEYKKEIQPEIDAMIAVELGVAPSM